VKRVVEWICCALHCNQKIRRASKTLTHFRFYFLSC